MSESFVDPTQLQRKEGHDVKTLHPGPNSESWQGGDSLRAADGKQQSQVTDTSKASTSQHDSSPDGKSGNSAGSDESSTA